MRQLVNVIMNKKINLKYFWKLCWIISIAYALLMLLIPSFFIITADDFGARRQFVGLIKEYGSHIILRLTGFVAFIFWIYNIVLWHQNKGKIRSLLLLLFLNVLYAPIYYLNKSFKKNLKRNKTTL